jgi:RNA polymerase sigma-70 factor (ECF subfamily)
VTEDETIRALLQRVRGGDGSAATELVRRYEPEIRRAVRIRLTDPRLRRVLDSMDVCQSVLGNFFVRIAGGQYDLEQPHDLLRLLVAMARNKVLDHVRRQQAVRRDQRRAEADPSEAFDKAEDAAPGPSRIVAGQDLLQEVRRRLTDEERDLADQRGLGRDWNAIAGERGANADALRKKLTRALDRVSRELGLEDCDHA